LRDLLLSKVNVTKILLYGMMWKGEREKEVDHEVDHSLQVIL